jgi:pilus assembly protein CpaC
VKRIACRGLMAGALLAAATATVNAEEHPKSTAQTRLGRLLQLDLVVGENRTLSARGVRNYSEGAAGIADVKLTTDRSKFVVVGKRPGTTTLLLIHQDGSQSTWNIHVFRRSPAEVEQEVRQLLQSNPELSVRRVGRRFFIEGSTASAAELARVERIAQLYPQQVESLVVEGVPAPAQKLNIRVDFFFVQYDKRSGYTFGVDWPARWGGESIHNQATFDLLRHTTNSATASVVDQPLPALDVASHDGWAKVLQRSTVVTANGSEATFDSGGEQNFAVSAAQTASIQPIPYGTKVVVLPRLDARSGHLEVEVTADVAHLVPAVLGASLPGRSLAHLNTTVQMQLGQSLVLSGLRATARRASDTGLPGLAGLPLVGVFFGSHQAATEDVENALLVVPTAVETVSRSARELVVGALREFSRHTGEVPALDGPRPSERWRRGAARTHE